MKKTISIIISTAVLLCFCISVHAESVYRYGNWTLTLLPDTDDFAFGVRSYDADDAVVTVPEDYGGYPIIALNGYAFAANTTMREISLSDQIVSVGNGAFLSASGLEKVELTASVSSVGESAFAYTTALKEIDLDDSSVETVSKRAFQGSGIETIALPEVCTAIGDYAFAQCENLTAVAVPDSVTEIGDSAFLGSSCVVIHASSGSFAIAYAKEHGIDYVCTDAISYVLGDADNSGEVDVIDVTVIQRELIGLYVYDPEIVERNGDVDGDGLNITDATWIQRYIASMETPYEIGRTIIIQL